MMETGGSGGFVVRHENKRRLGVGRGGMLVIVAGVALVLLATVLAIAWPRPAGIGSVIVEDAAGPVALADRLRPVSLVHFWATWCPPCREEVAALGRFAADRRGDSTFAVLMLAVEDDPAAMRTFVAERGFDPTTVLAARWRAAGALGVDALPSTVLVVDGKLVTRFLGAQNWDAASIRRQIDAAVARSRKARGDEG